MKKIITIKAPIQRKETIRLTIPVCCAVLSHSVVSDSSGPHGLQPTRLLCPWAFSRQEYWSGLPCPPPRDLPDPGIEPGSPALQENSLPAELPGKPLFVCTLVCEVNSNEYLNLVIICSDERNIFSWRD